MVQMLSRTLPDDVDKSGTHLQSATNRKIGGQASAGKLGNIDHDERIMME